MLFSSIPLSWRILVRSSECLVFLETDLADHCHHLFAHYFATIQSQRNVLFHSKFLGNSAGRVFVWDIDFDGSLPRDRFTRPIDMNNAATQKENAHVQLTHPHCVSTVRYATFSPDGMSIIVCCEDGTLWRWDHTSGKKRKKT